jgi:RNA polymerase sigma factor (sigma-70 family)
MTIADTLRQLGRSAPDPRSDGELLTRFVAAHDEPAFVELLRRHGPTLYGVCRRVLGNGPDADDAFQAVCLVLARKGSSLRTPGAVGPWLYGVAVRTENKARVMTVRAARREQRAAAGRAAPAPQRNAPDTLVVIDAELVALPDRYRAAFVTCDLNGRTRSEAARELGWPEGTVAARVAKARELLAARLRKRGVTLGFGLFAAVAVPPATATEALNAVRELLAVGTASAVAPAAQLLSDEVVKSVTTRHAKWLLLGGLVLALGAGGAVLLATPVDKGPVREPVKAPVPKASATVWQEAKPIVPAEPARITAIGFSPDGASFVIAQRSRIHLYDTATRKFTREVVNIKEAEDDITSVRFHPDGKLIGVVTNNDYGLCRVEQRLGSYGFYSWVGGMRTVAFSGDGKWLAATNGHVTAVHPTDPEKRMEKPVLFEPLGGEQKPKEAPPSAVAFSPKGDRLLLLPNIRVPADWQYDPKADFTVPDQKAATHSVAVVWPTAGGKPSRVLKHGPARLTAADWSADGKRIVTADEKGTLVVWDGERFQEKSRLELGEGVVQLAVAPDGKTVAVVRAFPSQAILGGGFGARTGLEVHLFDLTDPPAKPKPLWTTGDTPLPGKIDGPVSLAFSPDGKTLLAAFADPFPSAGKNDRLKSMGVKVWELVPKK